MYEHTHTPAGGPEEWQVYFCGGVAVPWIFFMGVGRKFQAHILNII